MNENPSRCPDCGAALPADSPQALCPACLIRQALASRTLVEGDHRAPAGPPLTPEELAEKFPGYEILECLGRGGMGVVYKARQKSLDRIVAIKILPPECVGEARFSDRFAIEAATLAKLSHPNIVTVHDFGETAGLFYIVMEYVDGVNLRDLLREGKLEPQQALAIVPPICDALQYAHDKGIVHRDIKPENLLLDRGGRVKIADFGIASLMGAAGEIAGTPPYMAPEQNGANIDHRADIYALGVVLYEMLTGQRPEKDLIAPSRKVQIDVRLDEMVLRALEKEPERRYQTAGEFRTVVETVAAGPPSAQEDSDRRKKRRKKVVFRFLDPLPCKSDLLRMALTMMLAGLAIIALMDGTWEKAREWIDRTFYPGDTTGEYYSRNVLILSCLLIFTALVWKLLRGLGHEAGGNRGSGIKFVWLVLGLAALFLVFYNPWGPAAWQWMIAAAALLSIGSLLFSRNQVPESGGRPSGSATFAGISVILLLVLTATGDARAMMAGAGILLVAGLLWFARGNARLALLVALAALGVAGGVVLLLIPKKGGGDSAGATMETLRVKFSFSHPEALSGGSELTLPATTHSSRWFPNSGQPMSLANERTVLIRVRLLESHHANVKAEAACSEDGTSWETRMIPLDAAAPKGEWRFKNGTVVKVGLQQGGTVGGNQRPAPGFGPVVERELRLGDKLMFLGLDFESGDLVARTKDEFGRAANDEKSRKWYRCPREWVESKGVDMVVGGSGDEFGIAGLESHFELQALPDNAWNDANEADLAKALDRFRMWNEDGWVALQIEANAAVPLTYAMRSGDCLGLLQLTGRLKNPDGIKLRYKLWLKHTSVEIHAPKAGSAGRADQVLIEDLALHMIVAIRGKDDAKLKSLAADRIKGWPEALPVFAVELRERMRQITGDDRFDLRAGESLVDGDFGAVRCTGPAALQGKCLVLFFVRTDGGWRNLSLRNATQETPLAAMLADLRSQLEKSAGPRNGSR